MDRWSLQGFHFQRYLEMFAENQTDLYMGNWASAWRRSDERWPRMKSSLLLRIPFVKLEALHLIGRAAFAAAAATGDVTLIERAERNAREIEKEKTSAWAQPFALAIRAGVESHRGAHDNAADTLSLAARAFEKWDLLLYAKPPTTATASSPAAPAEPPPPRVSRNGRTREGVLAFSPARDRRD